MHHIVVNMRAFVVTLEFFTFWYYHVCMGVSRDFVKVSNSEGRAVA
jgi:hypothetical protein